MRTSAFLTAAFAATALSAPFAGKRDLDVDTVYDVVYVTEMVTETADAPAASATSTTLVQYGHRHSHSAASTSTVVVTSAKTSSEAAPSSTSTSSAYVAPTTTAPAATSTAAASTSAALSSSAAQTSSAASSVATTYQELVVAHHNVHRANHSAADVTWSANLASIALSIAQTCVYEHNTTAGGGGYGQNIAAGVQSAQIGEVISDLFYNGEVNWFNGLYGEAQPDMTNFEHWGHFSQIVWMATSQVGCATYDCSASGLANVGSDVAPYFTVCNYESPGNYANEYGANIGEPLGAATITGSETVYN